MALNILNYEEMSKQKSTKLRQKENELKNKLAKLKIQINRENERNVDLGRLKRDIEFVQRMNQISVKVNNELDNKENDEKAKKEIFEKVTNWID